MPKQDDHLAVAKRNDEVIQHLSNSSPNYPEWVATVAFYCAVHLVEALLSKNQTHSCNHEGREQLLKKEKKYHNIYKHYAPLKGASLVARYLVKHPRFSDYMSAEQVQSELVNHHLKQIRKSVEKQLRH